MTRKRRHWCEHLSCWMSALWFPSMAVPLPSAIGTIALRTQHSTRNRGIFLSHCREFWPICYIIEDFHLKLLQVAFQSKCIDDFVCRCVCAVLRWIIHYRIGEYCGWRILYGSLFALECDARPAAPWHPWTKWAVSHVRLTRQLAFVWWLTKNIFDLLKASDSGSIRRFEGWSSREINGMH